VRACKILGVSRATLHRHRNPRSPRLGPRRPFHHPAELSADERQQVLAVLLDEGVYLCSVATMYRLLRQRGQAGERRAQPGIRRK
jgi:putative transposase